MTLAQVLVSPATAVTVIAVVALVAIVAFVLWSRRSRRNNASSPLEKATFSTLHTVALAAPVLREGLSAHSPRRCPTCASCWTRPRSR